MCRKMFISERFLMIDVDLHRFLSIFINNVDLPCQICQALSTSVEAADGGTSNDNLLHFPTILDSVQYFKSHYSNQDRQLKQNDTREIR